MFQIFTAIVGAIRQKFFKKARLNNDKLGEDGENRAIQFLKKQGYRIVDRNVRFSIGEIDIIAKIAKTLVIVEVKTRRSAAYSHPIEAVNAEKRRKIRQMGLRYFYTKNYKKRGFSLRFDIITLIWAENQEPIIEHFSNAF